jgi:hypothetical protein
MTVLHMPITYVTVPSHIKCNASLICSALAPRYFQRNEKEFDCIELVMKRNAYVGA